MKQCAPHLSVQIVLVAQLVSALAALHIRSDSLIMPHHIAKVSQSAKHNLTAMWLGN